MREQAINRLQEHGIRPSEQRIVIMEYLLSHRTHPTVDAIYKALSPKMPTLSRTTVYNTLKLLEESKTILELSIDKRNSHYDGDTSQHSHFLCRECGKKIDIPEQSITMACESYETSYIIEETEIYYRGLCGDCIAKKKTN